MSENENISWRDVVIKPLRHQHKGILMADVTRVPYPEHPNRCQSMKYGDQCPMFGVKLSDDPVKYGSHCMLHGGNRALDTAKKESLSNYQLTKWHARLQRHTDAPGIKSLRDEIGILRMVLEERLNRCNEDIDFVMHSGPISDLVLKIERLVTSCHRLEGSMGQLLDKTAVLQFASVVISIISQEVKDESAMARISNAIVKAIGDTGETSDDTMDKESGSSEVR